LQHGLTGVKSWCERCNVKSDKGKTQATSFYRRLGVPDDVLQLNGLDILFVNGVTYLDVTCDRRTTWRLHIERTIAKALRTHLRTYSVFRSERLSTNTKLMIDKALIRSVMIYACPTWKFVVDTHLLKLQCLQNRVFSSIGNLHRCMPVLELRVAFKIPYIYNYITDLCRTQAEVILNHAIQSHA
jgi:hypothetical protein